MSFFQIWFLAIRSKTLPAAISPVIIGTALVFNENQIHWLSAFFCLFCALLIQISANLANDYFDAKKGADTNNRKGPLRVTHAGLVNQKQMKIALSLVFFLTILGGIYLVYRGGWPILIIGLLSLLFSFLYTAGPFALAYLGLGDIFAFIFFGIIAVGGTYYVQTLSINPLVILMGFLPGLLSVAILTVNNYRDIDEDKIHNKKTLVVRWGKNFARFEYISTLVCASIFPLIYAWFYPEHKFLLILTFLLGITFSLSLINTFLNNKKPEELNLLLGKTGKLLFIYSITFSLALLI